MDSNLLAEHEWTGQFFPPGRQDLAFGGRLKYSPTDGVRLEYARPLGPSGRELKWDVLHGNTSTGIPLTLVGEFGSGSEGIAINNGMHYWTSSGHPFKYAIFGFHFGADAEFDAFEFDLTGSQEFFLPDGAKDLVPHSREDVVTSRLKQGSVKVVHFSSFNFVSSNLSAHFFSDESDSMKELQEAYDAIRDKNPRFRPYLKKNLDYLFKFVPTRQLSMSEATRTLESLTDLFALMACEPVRLKKLDAIVRDQDGWPRTMVVFPFAIDDPASIARSQEKRDFHVAPLNNSDVDLGLLIERWVQVRDRFRSITSSVQSMTDTVGIHETHGSIVLSATMLEDMAAEAGSAAKKLKYEYGLRNYASPSLLKNLSTQLQCKEEEIGKAISSVRSEIAHVRKAKVYLNRLGNRRAYLVSKSLQLVVLGYILEQIGVTTAAREKYQNALTRAD